MREDELEVGAQRQAQQPVNGRNRPHARQVQAISPPDPLRQLIPYAAELGEQIRGAIYRGGGHLKIATVFIRNLGGGSMDPATMRANQAPRRPLLLLS